MTDETQNTVDELSHATAAFIRQALELDDDVMTLAADLSTIKRDANAAIFTIQLDSSVGPAAFLVYTYILDRTGGDGHTGQELYDGGLQTLQQAHQRNAPGPRAVAHASTEEHGFILATTPGTYRALIGAPVADTLEPGAEDLISTENTDAARSDSAEKLLELLRSANEEARSWLRAIQAATQQAPGDDDRALVSFSEHETALALFLLDESGIGDLLRMMNLLVATAQEQTAAALSEIDGEDGDEGSQADMLGYVEELPDLPDLDDTTPIDPVTGTWPHRD